MFFGAAKVRKKVPMIPEERVRMEVRVSVGAR